MIVACFTLVNNVNNIVRVLFWLIFTHHFKKYVDCCLKPEMLHLLSLNISPSVHTLSNAFCKSIHTESVFVFFTLKSISYFLCQICVHSVH